jgi:hypothetical protein
VRGPGTVIVGPGIDADPGRGWPGGPAAGRRPQSRAPHPRCLTRPPAAYQSRSRGAKTRRSGPQLERKGEGAGAKALAQGQCGCRPGSKERRGPGDSARAEQPSRREQVPKAPAWRRLLRRGAGPQAPQNGGGGKAERSSSTSATAPTAGGEARGSAAAFPKTADSSPATSEAVPIDTTTTTDGAEAATPTPATRSAGSRRPSPEVRGVLVREEGPPSRPGQMGVV